MPGFRDIISQSVSEHMGMRQPGVRKRWGYWKGECFSYAVSHSVSSAQHLGPTMDMEVLLVDQTRVPLQKKFFFRTRAKLHILLAKALSKVSHLVTPGFFSESVSVGSFRFCFGGI